MFPSRPLSRPSAPTTSLILAILVLASTSPSIVRAYRLADELPALSGLGPVRWPTHQIHFRIAGDGAPSIGLAATSAAVEDAFAVWESVSCGPVDFRYEGGGFDAAPGDGINSIEWVPDGLAGLGLAPDAIGFTDILYAEQPDGTWVIAEADIYLDGSSPHWTTDTHADQPGLRSIPTAIAHELGHVLGILHPCEPAAAEGAPDCEADPEFVEATMYPLYQGVAQFSLGTDDEAAFCHIYAAESCAVSCPLTDVCDGDRCLDPCGDSLCGPDEVCSAGRCVQDCGTFYCSPPSECGTDGDCPSGTVCSSGSCVPQRAHQPGDPCALDVDCVTGLCFDGYCTFACVDECPAGFSCARTPLDDASVCEAQLGVLGEPCGYGYECTSYVCLIEAGAAEGICSRPCDASSGCPSDYSCLAASGEAFCGPVAATCSVIPGFPNGDRSPTPLLFVLCLLALVRARIRGFHAS